MTAAQDEINTFNESHPEYRIKPKSVIQSWKSMNRRSNRMEFGVDLDPKLAPWIKDKTAPSIYAR